MRILPQILLAAAAVTAFGQTLTSEPVANPSAKGSLQPNWSTSPDGKAVLSWIEPSKKEGLFTLRYAVQGPNGWSQPRTVAADRHFFRHPAEVPEVMALNDHQWIAHWVEMPNESSEAEFVYVSSSSDGMRWSTPVMAHKDKSEVEHGLASMVPSGNGEASLMWLEMLKGEDGPAALKRTVVNASGQVVKEETLISDVCSCCPTAIARTGKGLLVAYRAHTPQDIRDIAITRFENGKWSAGKIVNADNWHINACPTNAAAVAARGDRAAVAWYTGANDSPKVQVVFSTDGGTTLSKPVLVSTGHAYGYTAVAMADDGSAYVSWLQQAKDGSAQVLVRHVTPAGVVGPVTQIAAGGRMSLGYPRVFSSAANTFIAWGGTSQLQVARLK